MFAYGVAAAELGAGATANLVCFKYLDNRNSYLPKVGGLKVNPYPAIDRFKSGDGRVGKGRHAAHIKVGIWGRGGARAAFVSDADIPALLR